MKTVEDVAREMQEQLRQENPEGFARYQQMHAMLDRADSVAEIFDAYRFGVIPSHAPVVQLRETEQAVYAACHAFLQAFLRNLDQCQGEGEHMNNWIEARQSECQAYALKRAAEGKMH